MLQFLTLAALCVLALGLDQQEIHQHWNQFKSQHNKLYVDEAEEARRFDVFSTNYNFIQEHNAKAAKGQFSFTLGINQFADMTYEEFASKFLNYKGSAKQAAPLRHNVANSSLPSSVDWRTKGAVTGVKNQGSCGGCWAFSATAAIEGARAIKTGNLVSLSEQNLIDCSKAEQNEGCEGGLMDYAFEYVIKNGGIDTESAYPFQGEDASCRYSSANRGATIKSYVDVPTKDEQALESAVAQQPVSVAIHASLFLQLYSGGVFDVSFLCPSDADHLNHGVTAVGYGSTTKKDFWIVKNSWGASWGEKGYFRLRRGKNLCGIATQASYVVV